MFRFTTITLLVVLSLIGLSDQALSQTAQEYTTAINIAGRQRMLTQKMSKEFFLIQLGIAPDANRKNLTGTIALFEGSLDKLIAGDKGAGIPVPPNKQILAQLGKAKKMWGAFGPAIRKGLASGKADKATLMLITRSNIPLLKEMNKGVGMYAAASRAAGIPSAGKVVNLAGRQRMLTQKMSKEVCMLALEIQPKESLAALEGTRALFAKTHKALLEGDKVLGLPPTTDANIRKQMVETVGKLWKEFTALLDQVGDGKNIEPALLGKIAKLNPTLLKEMNRAVGMYAAASKKAN